MKQPYQRAFTIVEMLTVMGAIALLAGLMIPALRSFRESSGETNCASNLRQLGVATIAYMATYKEHLPQVGIDTDGDDVKDTLVGALFGGRRGHLPAGSPLLPLGINDLGADKRPLNKYLGSGAVIVDPDPLDDNEMEDVPVFQCPLDRGQPDQGPYLPGTDSMYSLIGTSYTLNDHTLDGEDYWTLIPKQTPACADQMDPGVPRKVGGKMTRVEDAAKTWMLGDLPIYNYQQGGDRKQRWHYDHVRCNLCFVDGHVASGVEIPIGVLNTTKKYTFLPRPDWLSTESIAQNCFPPLP